MMTTTRQFILATYVLVLGALSVWAFSHGVEPRTVAGEDHPRLVISVAAICIAAWGHLLFHLFRGMTKRELSSGWCPFLLIGAFAIIFLILGCFGPWAGV